MELLANWLWQGTAIAFVSTVVLRMASRRLSATTRGHVWWATLAVVIALPFLPLIRSSIPAGDVRAAATPAIASSVAPTPAARAELPLSVKVPALPGWSVSLFLFMWIAGSSACCFRIVAAVIALRRIKRSVRAFPADREAALPGWLTVRSDGRPARLVMSDQIRAAAVLGLGTPTIAVAPSALDALTHDELDRVVVHEWAHVQRRDDFAQLLQRVIVAAAGLHPAVWWIDRQLHLERETACDDWALNVTGSARGLALCLTKLAVLPPTSADPMLVPSALSTSELTTRVVRLLDTRRNTSTTPRIGVPLALSASLAMLAIAVAGVELVVTVPRSLLAAEAPVGRSTDSTPPVRHDVNDLLEAPVAPIARPSIASRREPARPTVVQAQLSEAVPAVDQQPASGRTSSPPPSSEHLVQPHVPVAQGLATVPLQVDGLPGVVAAVPAEVEAEVTGSVDTPEAPPVRMTAPWDVAAGAGVSVGKGSQKAAVATAGFFSRFGKSIAKVF